MRQPTDRLRGAPNTRFREFSTVISRVSAVQINRAPPIGPTRAKVSLLSTLVSTRSISSATL
jgi:hypothetical protein